jgi:hypothetical protein
MRDIDRALVVRTLIETRCNITKAAVKLGVPSHALRRLAAYDMEIIDLALEQREQLCDRAEEIVYEALHDLDDKTRRDVMARFVLSSDMARDRGLGPRAPRANVVNTAQNIIVGWASDKDFDGSVGDDDMANFHNNGSTVEHDPST